MLPPLPFAKLLKCYQESWMLLSKKPKKNCTVIEALDPFFMAITSTLFISKVLHNLYMLWMYIWMRPYHVNTSLINQAFRFYWESWKMLGNKPRHCEVVEALDSFKKPPHQFQTYVRWLTTCICCGCADGCANGCGLTMLQPLSLAKLLGWSYCNSRVILGTKPQHYAVVEALDSFIMTLTSVSNICKVLDKIFICCGCTYGCILTTFLPLSLAKLLKFYQES